MRDNKMHNRIFPATARRMLHNFSIAAVLATALHAMADDAYPSQKMPSPYTMYRNLLEQAGAIQVTRLAELIEGMYLAYFPCRPHTESYRAGTAYLYLVFLVARGYDVGF